MSAMNPWLVALSAGALVLGVSATAQAQSNVVAEYCVSSLKNDPGAKDFPDVAKFCGCVGDKVAAADRAITVTVMKASDEARLKGGRLDPATLPPDQAKALDTLRGLVPTCMAGLAPPAATPAPAPTATPAPTPAPTPSAPPPAKVTGIAAWSQLVGNTVSGKVDGKDYAEFYLPDGTVKTMADSDLMTGKWTLEGDKVCFVYPKDDKQCFAVELVGDDVTFTDNSGSGIRVKLLKGNPKNL